MKLVRLHTRTFIKQTNITVFHLNYVDDDVKYTDDIPVHVSVVHSGQYNMNIIFDKRLPGLGFL